jgi:Putative addiction module component
MTFAFLPGTDHLGGMRALEILQLPRLEKVRLMEALWEDLTREDSQYESPAWHGELLRETSERLARGEEQVIDWDEAKAKLRDGNA